MLFMFSLEQRNGTRVIIMHSLKVVSGFLKGLADLKFLTGFVYIPVARFFVGGAPFWIIGIHQYVDAVSM